MVQKQHQMALNLDIVRDSFFSLYADCLHLVPHMNIFMLKTYLYCILLEHISIRYIVRVILKLEKFS